MLILIGLTKMVVCRVYFSETPVQAVKEHDQELNKLGADALIPAMPGHVVQAFTLLKSSSEAQVCNCNTSLLLWLTFSQLVTIIYMALYTHTISLKLLLERDT
jgi:hypothetical protein